MTSADRQWWRRYDRYLNSQGWKLTHEACFRRDGYRCRRCGLAGLPSNPLQADHLTYENYNRFGQTPVGDLRTLCRHCHEITTGQKFPDRAFSHWLWQWWWRLTLRQKAVLVVVAWLALALIRYALVPAGQLRPVSIVTPDAGSTLIMPSRTVVRHHRYGARTAGPPAG